MYVYVDSLMMDRWMCQSRRLDVCICFRTFVCDSLFDYLIELSIQFVSMCQQSFQFWTQKYGTSFFITFWRWIYKNMYSQIYEIICHQNSIISIWPQTLLPRKNIITPDIWCTLQLSTVLALTQLGIRQSDWWRAGIRSTNLHIVVESSTNHGQTTARFRSFFR